MMKIELKQLEGKNYEEGETILVDAGYLLQESCDDEENNVCDVITSSYFYLYDEEGNEIDLVSHEMYINITGKEDGARLGKVIREEWQQGDDIVLAEFDIEKTTIL